MNDTDQLKGTPFDTRSNSGKLPGSLNTLTILTFIGSGLGLLSSLWNWIKGKEALENMEKMQGSDALEKMPDFAKNMFSPEAIQIVRASYENRIPLLILGLAGLALCVYGAMQMRALKKQGYFLWLIGEILPIIGGVIFVGTGMFSNLTGMVIMGITVLFVILYTLQLKYLK